MSALNQGLYKSFSGVVMPLGVLYQLGIGFIYLVLPSRIATLSGQYEIPQTLAWPL